MVTIKKRGKLRYTILYNSDIFIFYQCDKSEVPTMFT